MDQDMNKGDENKLKQKKIEAFISRFGQQLAA